MEMLASAVLALTMVAWPGHPHLTLRHLTLLLRQIHEMMKKANKKMTTMSEASRRPPPPSQTVFGA
jgi:type III secretory pathway component EscV